jgi:hypothetical protein
MISPTFKPVLAMKKFDESEYINVRTYWELSYTHPSGGTFCLVVKHQHPQDVVQRIMHCEIGERKRVITTAEWNREKAEIALQFEGTPEELRDAWSEESHRYYICNTAELEIFEELERYWTAICMLIKLEINN